MNFNLVLKAEAVRDLEEAFDWYENQKIGLGSEFLNQVDKNLEKIIQNPFQYKLDRNHRVLILPHFPFKIVFEVEEENIIVFAVYHAKRNPEKLLGRK